MEMDVGKTPQHAGTRKITVRVSYAALQALDAVRLRNGGRVTTYATQLLECSKSIDPRLWHAALATFERVGTIRSPHENKTIHPDPRRRDREET